MSAPIRNGEVGWIVTTKSGRVPLVASSQRTACWSTGTMPASSVASSAGRVNGTSAPAARAAAAIDSLSVETMNRPSRFDSRQDATAWEISERDPSIRRFLPGSPFEPPRAGMTANAKGAATGLDLDPAPLRGGAAGRVDDLHRLEAVPAVAAWH